MGWTHWPKSIQMYILIAIQIVIPLFLLIKVLVFYKKVPAFFVEGMVLFVFIWFRILFFSILRKLNVRKFPTPLFVLSLAGKHILPELQRPEALH